MYKTLISVSVLPVLLASLAEAAPPEPQQAEPQQQLSAVIGEFVSFDVSPIFSDPDGDELTYHLDFGVPLPTGLTLDPATGIVSGILEDLGPDIGTYLYFYATDPSGGRSSWQAIVLWTPLSHGPITSVFYRTCNPDLFDCIPGYNFQVQPRGFVSSVNPNGSSSVSIFPEPPTPEETRASASVGYEGDELTPAISAFLKPGDERMTASHLGLAKYLLTSPSVTINATLTYSQTGGVLGPAPLNPGDSLDYGAMLRARLLAFRLAPEANGVIDGSLCDWEGLGYMTQFGGGGSFRDLTGCITRGGHPHVLGYQETLFALPETGDPVQGDLTITPEVVDGILDAGLTIIKPLGPPTDIYLGVDMFQLARYGGVVDSQNTFRVVIENPDAIEPNMEGITEPSFEIAPVSGGIFEASVNDGMCIKINGHGRIPVVVFGDETLAVVDIDQQSFTFGDFPLATRGRGKKLACSVDYADPDPYEDLVCQFLDDGSELAGAPGPVQLSLKLNGQPETYYAVDDVCLD